MFEIPPWTFQIGLVVYMFYFITKYTDRIIGNFHNLVQLAFHLLVSGRGIYVHWVYLPSYL